MGHRDVSSGCHLFNTVEFAGALRHLRQDLRFDSGSGLCRLHTRLLRHSSLFEQRRCLRHRLVLPALRRHLLVRRALHLWLRRGFHLGCCCWLGFGLRIRLCLEQLLLSGSMVGPTSYAGAAYYGRYGYGGVAAANVYGQWGNVAYSGTKAAWANPYTGNYGRGGVVTGTNTVTGTRYAARGGTNTNVYTGTTVTGGGAVAYNPNTGRISAGQAGSVSNAYTGNAAAGTRGVGYNPQTGVISGGAVGGVKSGSTGNVTTGGGGFAYNTKTNTGVAVGNNNVYAGKNGDIYRYNPSTGVQQHTDGGWQSVQRQQDRSWVQNQQQSRSLGQQRTQNFSSMRGSLGGGGGFRGLGGRRR